MGKCQRQSHVLCASFGGMPTRGRAELLAPAGLAMLNLPASGLADSLKILLLSFKAVVTAHPMELFTSTRFYEAED